MLAKYDVYLRRQAHRDARKRIFVSQGLLAPWHLISLGLVVGWRASGQHLLLALWPPVLVGTVWVLRRILRHAAEFDRTPPPAPWLQTEQGQALVNALARVTLSPLTGVTLETKLRTDLRLTDRDQFELAKILAAPSGLDALSDRLRQDADMTVAELLDAIAVPAAVRHPATSFIGGEMAAYLVLDLTVKDLPEFLPYVEAIPAFIAKHGGRYISKGADPTVIEGDWTPQRLVILEFPSRNDAKAFLADPDAQALFARRHRSTTSRLILVDGEQ